MRSLSCAVLALMTFIQPSLAADCLNRNDATALKIAVMRQQLIVAALRCGEAGSYHLFADGFRDDLRQADNRVQTYFTARGGKGEYDAFRTKAAQLAWAAHSADGKGFCADARALLTAAKSYRVLDAFAQARSGKGNALCLPKAAPVAAPVPLAAPMPAPIAIAPRAIKAVPLRVAAAVKPLAIADIEMPQDEAPKIGRYYTPPLDVYDVDDVAEPTPPVRQARQDEPREMPYVRRDWNERGYGPAYGWREPPQAAWQPRDAWPQNDWHAPRDDWQDDADWYDDDADWSW